MDRKSEKPLRVFVNPFSIWNDLAFKTGQAIWASVHAAAVRSSTAPKVAVIPTADAPAPKVQEAAAKAVRPKAPRAKRRSKANAKRRATR